MASELPNQHHQHRGRGPAQFSAAFPLLLALIFAAQTFAQQPASAPATGAPWQPQLHFYAPPNWINDPNGPILLNGQYHVFFQFNPFGDQWGHMSWGHAVSPDLAHWKQLPLALPEENGVMIFSGSTVEDRDNSSGLCGDPGKPTPGCLVAIYTGASFADKAKDPQSKDLQTQNLAISRDAGATWTKYAFNPVLDLGLKDFRDPKVFWHAPSQSWVMVVALPDQHKVRFYRSKNLRQWDLAGEFGPAGAVGGVWECPDLMELTVRDAKGSRVSSRWVLSVNLNPGGPAGGSADQYFVGQFDGSRFVEDHPGSGPHWADRGKDFYASTSFSNIPAGEDRLWIAWMGNWQYADKLPSLPGRGEMTLARRIFLRQPPAHPAPTPGQEPLLLVQQPILPTPAFKPSGALFGAAPYQTLAQANARIAAQKLSGSGYLLRVTLDPGDAAEAGVRLRRSSLNPGDPAQEETVVGIDRNTGQIFVDRTRSGATAWSPAFPARVSAPLKHPQENSIRMEIAVDRNSVEVFAEDGETVLTNLIYPSATSQGLAFYSTPTPPGVGPALVRSVEFIPLDQPPAAK
ncbi:MAG: glycoside hydrolase family 32 protein [Terracidiphilus sp.]|jgi:sucrose-6-phosphate hydrolase SacC (GH32 family)